MFTSITSCTYCSKFSPNVSKKYFKHSYVQLRQSHIFRRFIAREYSFQPWIIGVYSNIFFGRICGYSYHHFDNVLRFYRVRNMICGWYGNIFWISRGCCYCWGVQILQGGSFGSMMGNAVSWSSATRLGVELSARRDVVFGSSNVRHTCLIFSKIGETCSPVSITGIQSLDLLQQGVILSYPQEGM